MLSEADRKREEFIAFYKNQWLVHRPTDWGGASTTLAKRVDAISKTAMAIRGMVENAAKEEREEITKLLKQCQVNKWAELEWRTPGGVLVSWRGWVPRLWPVLYWVRKCQNQVTLTRKDEQ